MSNKYYTAIVFMADQSKPIRKYRNINNINSFIRFCESIEASYFNIYSKSTKLFVERIYIKKGV
jgi:hypothetical protein